MLPSNPAAFSNVLLREPGSGTGIGMGGAIEDCHTPEAFFSKAREDIRLLHLELGFNHLVMWRHRGQKPIVTQ